MIFTHVYRKSRTFRPIHHKLRRPRRRRRRMTCVPAYSLHRPQRPPLTPGPVCAGEVGYWDWGGRAHHGTRNSPPGNGRNSGQMPRSNRPDSTAAIHVAGRRRPSDGRQPDGRSAALPPRPSFDCAGAGVGGGVRARKPPPRAGRPALGRNAGPLPSAPAAVESKTTTVRYRPQGLQNRWPKFKI